MQAIGGKTKKIVGIYKYLPLILLIPTESVESENGSAKGVQQWNGMHFP